MIQSITKARPRRSPNRVALVDIDGTPVRRPTKDFALSWPPSADDWRWECGSCPEDLAAHVAPPGIEPEGGFPSQDDLDWLAATLSQEAAERERIEREYPVDPEYDRYLDRVDAALPPYDQVSPDELAQLAAHGCI